MNTEAAGGRAPHHLKHQKQTVLLLAGGSGSRMGAISAEQQKCCMEVSGLPIIVHLINELEEAFPHLALEVAVSHLSNQVEEVVAKHIRDNERVSARYSRHELGADLVGTYLSMKNVLEGNQPIMRVSGDMIVPSSVYAKTAEIAQNSDHTVVVTANGAYANEVNTHFLMKPDPDNPEKLGEYVKPVGDEVPDGFGRDQSINYWGKLADVYSLINTLYPDAERHGGSSFRKIEFLRARGRVGLNFNDEPWLHLGYPEDLQKTWPR